MNRNELQRIAEFGELQNALETIEELQAKNAFLQSIIDELLDNVPPKIVATKESPETVLERFNRECDL